MNPLCNILTTDGGYDIYQITISAVGLYFLPAPFTMQAMGKAWGAKKSAGKGNQAMAARFIAYGQDSGK